ncbi:nitroreductase/quinone reductase family protein [Nocardia sp. 004]|uniref:nitroreductase/quinone reductase family protein n=1 Tax=Nocardia sp. 004 TaxID=3385978 RepID=UPI00399F190B
MSENDSTASKFNSGAMSYDDPDAPWNQEYTDEEVAGWNKDVIQEFRANDGKVGGAYAGSELVLLTTTGAKSGKQHVVPLGLLRRGETLYVSSFIEDKYPAWYHNAKADSRVTVELGSTTYRGAALVLESGAYEEFASWVLANNPLLAECQAKTTRPIPLVILELGDPIPS